MASSEGSSSSSSSSRSAAVNALGILGAVFWSVQLLPQIELNRRRRSTRGLQPSMMLLWASAGLALGVHNILSAQNVALQVQPQILTSLSLVTWAQVMHYGHRWSTLKSVVVLVSLSLLFGGAEAAVVCGVKFSRGPSAPTPKWLLLASASLASLLLCLGVLREYHDALQHRSVRGLSWGFVSLDAAGDLASLVSVALERVDDGGDGGGGGNVGGAGGESAGGEGRSGRGNGSSSREHAAALAIYASELGLWLGLMALGLVWNGRQAYRRRRMRRRGAAAPARLESGDPPRGERGSKPSEDQLGEQVEKQEGDREADEYREQQQEQQQQRGDSLTAPPTPPTPTPPEPPPPPPARPTSPDPPRSDSPSARTRIAR